ncbi:hypothetical protein [Azotobacter salinestris]|uniref:hypothetical protein n=1 Tax=Azotobacter salinestris TaxID=69964 RepID=UPI0032DEF54E
MSPRYIAIEGPKGCGKSTLLQRLPQRLRDYGLRVAMLCPTRPIPEPHPLERLAVGCDDDALRERLYAARSNYHARRVTQDAELILGDRSILTSYATRWDRAPAGQKRQHIERVNALENLIGLPDHVIQLNVPDAQLLTRLQVRHGRDYGKYDETPARLRSVLTAYREMRECGRELGLGSIVWHDIDADAPPAVVLARVVVRILGVLGLSSSKPQGPRLACRG